MSKQILYTLQFIQINIVNSSIYSISYLYAPADYYLYDIILLFITLFLIIITMQIKQLNSQCLYCNKNIDRNDDAYCDKCCQTLLSHLQHYKEEQTMLNNFIQDSHIDGESNQDNEEQIHEILSSLQKQQKQLKYQLDKLIMQNNQTQQSLILTFQNNLTQICKSNQKSLLLSQKLCREQIMNIKLTDEYQRLLRIRILQNFYEIQFHKKNHQCYLNGQKIKYNNLDFLLPVVSYILKEASLKNYERICLSEIYIDEGVILVFSKKNGPRVRDKQISINQNGGEWIHYVIEQFNNLTVYLKIQNIIPFRHLQKEIQKQCIYKLCTNLKFLIEMIDQSNSKK